MARPRTDIQPRILHAARARFASEGVDGASLRAIASDAGTNIGMVYYYYPTKDDLFLAVVEELYVALLADLEALLSARDTVRERVQALYERIARLSDEEVLMLRLILREALLSSARLARLIERFQRGHIPLLLRLLQEGCSDGTFAREHSPVVIGLSLIALAGPPQLIRRMLANLWPAVEAPSGTALARELVSVLFDGVGAKRPVL